MGSWRRDAKQRLETRKEQPVGLHPASEVFNSEVRTFFAAKSIATSEEILAYSALIRVYKDWRRDNKLYEMKVSYADKCEVCGHSL